MTEFQFVNLIIGALIPLLVAFLTHRHAPAWLKADLNVVLAAGGAALATTTDTTFTWKAFGLAFALQLGASLASHFGFLQPNQVTGQDGVAQQAGLALGAPSGDDGQITILEMCVVVALVILLLWAFGVVPK